MLASPRRTTPAKLPIGPGSTLDLPRLDQFLAASFSARAPKESAALAYPVSRLLQRQYHRPSPGFWSRTYVPATPEDKTSRSLRVIGAEPGPRPAPPSRSPSEEAGRELRRTVRARLVPPPSKSTAARNGCRGSSSRAPKNPFRACRIEKKPRTSMLANGPNRGSRLTSERALCPRSLLRPPRERLAAALRLGSRSCFSVKALSPVERRPGVRHETAGSSRRLRRPGRPQWARPSLLRSVDGVPRHEPLGRLRRPGAGGSGLPTCWANADVVVDFSPPDKHRTLINAQRPLPSTAAATSVPSAPTGCRYPRRSWREAARGGPHGETAFGVAAPTSLNRRPCCWM